MKKQFLLPSTLGLLVFFCLSSGAAAQQGAAPTATAQPLAKVQGEEAPLTNADVVKLCKLELGDEVVIAKINQAKAVDFKLDTDSLVALKQEGVSKAAIEAMLKRTSVPQAQAGPGASAAPALGGPSAVMPPSFATPGDEGVLLRTAQGETRLQSVQGDLSYTYAVFTMLTFLDFPGMRAGMRITDKHPTIVVRTSKDPRGRVFLVKCESNKKDNTRSVKVGKAGMFSQKSWSTPDGDWTVECDSKELPDNLWEITPKKDLKPGEYGILFAGGFSGMLSPMGAELFDFGVEK